MTLFVSIVSCITLLVLLYALYRMASFEKSAKTEKDVLPGVVAPVRDDLARLEKLQREEAARNREELSRSLSDARNESGNLFRGLSDTTTARLDAFNRTLLDNAKGTSDTLRSFSASQSENLGSFREKLEAGQKGVRDELLKMQSELNKLTESRLNAMRDTIDARLTSIRDENAKKLDEMRKTVDEKLQESVEKRFNESFKLISDRLEQVQKGLGEMQSLANGVGDLKKVLTNVKTRGCLGEIQLGAILDQCLARSQYATNVKIKKGSSELVEFAIRLPGRDPDGDGVLLPVDSKFPVEDYQRLLDAYDKGTQDEIRTARKSFESEVKRCASDISSKYIEPPVSTDFGVMFVPTEGLYAEILRVPGLFEELQSKFHVVVVGPANLAAFLNSLQMGFRTLAIEKRSDEVWNLLGAVKTEFGKFGDVLDATHKKLQTAIGDIDKAATRTRVIARKLKGVQELPEVEATALLGKGELGETDENQDE